MMHTGYLPHTVVVLAELTRPGLIFHVGSSTSEHSGTSLLWNLVVFFPYTTYWQSAFNQYSGFELMISFVVKNNKFIRVSIYNSYSYNTYEHKLYLFDSRYTLVVSYVCDLDKLGLASVFILTSQAVSWCNNYFLVEEGLLLVLIW